MTIKNKTRINLHIYAKQDDGKVVYHVHHIGFFPQSAVQAIVDNLNIVGIAYNSNTANQFGAVEVVTAVMDREPAGGPTSVVRHVDYEPPGTREG